MKKLTIFFLAVLSIITSHAQQLEGIITYEYKQNYAKIIQRLPYLSQEEKDRVKMSWGNEEGKQKMKLIFNPDESLYTYFSDQGQSEDGQWSWRQSDFLVERNFKNETITELHEMLGNTFVVQDSLHIPKWKILNQLKDIAGHVCMKAEMEEPAKKQKLIAWFADDIPVSIGPERSFGLPGAILELDVNDGDVVVTATTIEFKKLTNELALPKKMKGKKINEAGYNRVIQEHIKDSITAHRNPYWALRY
ncbi:MAG: GLPGLI family protein [Siphonobacter sp.]